MATTTRIERRKRGIFGWVFLILFWGFNAVMAVSLVGGLSENSTQYATLATDAERAGYAAGTAIGAGLMLTVWVMGAIILGLFVLLTRGSKVVVETREG